MFRYFKRENLELVEQNILRDKAYITQEDINNEVNLEDQLNSDCNMDLMMKLDKGIDNLVPEYSIYLKDILKSSDSSFFSKFCAYVEGLKRLD